jgi:hypothetical protein
MLALVLLFAAAGVDVESVYSDESSGVGSGAAMFCAGEDELVPGWLGLVVGGWVDEVDDALGGEIAGITAADAASRRRSSSASRRSGGLRSRLLPV